MTLREKQSLFVELVGKLIGFAVENGYELTFGDAWARSGHAKHSNHYVRLAVDLNLFKNGLYQTDTMSHLPLGEFWESLHELCCWGGRWGDGNHYSLEHEGRE